MAKTRIKLLYITILFFLTVSCGKKEIRETIDLSGKWQFRLDSLDIGEEEKWYNVPFNEIVTFPGSMTENGKGNNITVDTKWTGSFYKDEFLQSERYAPYRVKDRVKYPFFLQPVKEYVGAAWYKKEVFIPDTWKNKNIELSMERVHWYSSLWVDGMKVDTLCKTISTPHRYNLSGILTPGKHTVVLKVDNSYHLSIGTDASSITDHTQTNWNGVVGNIFLEAYETVHMKDVQVYPEVNNNRARVELVVESDKDLGETLFEIKVGSKEYRGELTEKSAIMKGENRVSFYYHFKEKAPLWDEYTPNLITLDIIMKGEEKVYDRKMVTFGMRNIEAKGKHFLLNGKRIILRGTLECCSFPLTGYPSCDVKDWIKIFDVCKQYGMNHVRFHSWCPPEAAFEAADRVGLYLQVECGIWYNTKGNPGSWDLKPWLFDESAHIIKEYANHPSFLLFAHGNEPWEWSREILREWVIETKKTDQRFLVCAGAHFPTDFEENDFNNPGGIEGYVLRSGNAFENEISSTVRNYDSQMSLHNKPEIAHEAGQWCAFPDLNQLEKYKGILKPYNMEIVRDFLEINGMLNLADSFLLASGKFQALLYKEEVEAFLRTSELGGYQLLGLQDFPGQGTALVGVVDVFWDNKGYISAEEYRKFNAEVVLLAECERRVWTNNDTFQANLLVSQYAEKDIRDGVIKWEIRTDEKVLKEGKLDVETIKRGNLSMLGSLSMPLSGIKKAEKITLHAEIENHNCQNDWDFWVYPELLDANEGKVLVTNQINEALLHLQEGGNVLLVPYSYKEIANNSRKDGKIVLTSDMNAAKEETTGTFEPIFWNKLWFGSQKSHTLGILCDPDHPILKDFPTEFHSNWQWQDIQHNCKPMILDSTEIKPIIQPIDDWNKCRKLGVLFEMKVNAGKLVVCSVDLLNDMEYRMVARQLRYSILNYMNSDSFNPSVDISPDKLKELFDLNSFTLRASER